MWFCFHRDEGHDAGDYTLLGGSMLIRAQKKKNLKIDMAKLEVTQW